MVRELIILEVFRKDGRPQARHCTKRGADVVPEEFARARVGLRLPRTRTSLSSLRVAATKSTSPKSDPFPPARRAKRSQGEKNFLQLFFCRDGANFASCGGLSVRMRHNPAVRAVRRRLCAGCAMPRDVLRELGEMLLEPCGIDMHVHWRSAHIHDGLCLLFCTPANQLLGKHTHCTARVRS